ncbi:hypothetical protein Cni_G04930 [Canna indica]|uniref:Reverse transcriptase domain-containing protein n=1 Tax=Canna indica TaxID=4628 RepID=A0AAQ3JVN4_9LILI|nr:hypothetical protein Cni_G04930 [Canna indica]
MRLVQKSKRKISYFVIKLDIEKAFDSVSWSGLNNILDLMNFPITGKKWLFACFSSANYRCFINGVQSDSFKSFKGVRHGDPLSPYFFIIIQELLSQILDNYMLNGKIKGFKYKGPSISHLFFADDILVFTKCNINYCKNLLETIDNYCDASNQKLNRSKSELFFSNNCPHKLKEDICSLFKIKDGHVPLKYLGSYIDSKRLNCNYQNIIVDKATERIDNWAGKNISQAGKIVLLNSMVNSILIHSLSSIWINDKVINRFRSVSRDFLWRTNSKKKAFHLLNWKVISTGKSCGGLGIRDIGLVKISVQAKRIFPFLNRKGQLWFKLLVQRYGIYHPWKPHDTTAGLWLQLCLLKPGPYGLALSKAKSLNLYFIECYSDCQTIINILNKSSKTPWFLKGLVTDILSLPDEINVLSWNFLGRSLNTKAHLLAKKGIAFFNSSGSSNVNSPSSRLTATNAIPLLGSSDEFITTLTPPPQFKRTPDANEVYHESLPPNKSLSDANSCLMENYSQCISHVNLPWKGSSDL